MTRPSPDDIPLYAEVLSQAADTFFGARCQVDAMVETFQRHVEKLKIVQGQVEAVAALLNFILPGPPATRAFFTGLAVDPEPFAGIAPSPAAWKQSLPFALTAKGRYVKVVGDVYSDLVRVCHEYMHGQPQPAGKKEVRVYHGLLVGMVDVINAEIRRINETLSPSQSLRFAKQFISTCPEAQVPDCRYGECLEEKLCLHPLTIGDVDLAVYPDLPPLETVAGKIAVFGKNLYRGHATAIGSILAVLGKKSPAMTPNPDEPA